LPQEFCRDNLFDELVAGLQNVAAGEEFMRKRIDFTA
jgi:hypothetical protein